MYGDNILDGLIDDDADIFHATRHRNRNHQEETSYFRSFAGGLLVLMTVGHIAKGYFFISYGLAALTIIGDIFYQKHNQNHHNDQYMGISMRPR